MTTSTKKGHGQGNRQLEESGGTREKLLSNLIERRGSLSNAPLQENPLHSHTLSWSIKFILHLTSHLQRPSLSPPRTSLFFVFFSLLFHN
ncbi:hypothetical protein BDV98DRAFT_577468 [Pterulicium gracile]|uniref:Uncharacterized protein n=1 Tax=Pterulicium gracile TaxID=1884261 RepID=A0A5C3Q5Y6_9AGAR|nr:hypothetical protein BDV98DRAFT_577468 [Pterula gracilis]